MYFLPQSNRFIAWIVTVKPLYLYLLSLSTAIVAVALWFFLAYAPLVALVEQQHRQLKQSQDQSAKMNALEKSYQELLIAVQQKQVTLDQYRNADKNSRDLQAGMLSLMHMAHQASIKVAGFSADNYEDKDWYAKQGLHLDMNASYAKILNFFQSCVQSKHMVSIKTLAMTRVSPDQFSIKINADFMTVK